MLEHDLVLKSDELFLVGNLTRDEPGRLASGLYLRDTRHLDYFAVTLAGQPLETLTAQLLSASRVIINRGNRLIESGAEPIPPLVISVEETFSLDTGLNARIRLRNHDRRAVRLPLRVEWTSDFRDLFDIRGFPRAGRGQIRPAQVHDGTVVLSYLGLDGHEVATEITFDQPATLEADRQASGRATATWDVALDPGASWQVTMHISPRRVSTARAAAVRRSAGGVDERPARLECDHVLFNQVLQRSRDDLEMLQTTFPEGALPAAGIPWYVAPFGRDSLIVGLQTVHIAPRRAAQTLRVLAALQGSKDDPWRDEEPGKILHEMRYGEMARCGEVPHTPYFGTVDATPLFVMLFAETIAWTGDRTLYQDLLPNVRRALTWIEEYGDLDGDGLIEYRSRSSEGVRIIHQGWKDSHDSLHHPDGTAVDQGAIALIEPQGYVYAAYDWLAAVAAMMGDAAWSAELKAKAERVQTLVESAFWLDDEGFYAQALDQEKRPVPAISSNPGHLLFCGLPLRDRAARVANRLMSPDLYAGWGIRTLSERMATYNPMSYHNGSIWPHDNSLIAAGLERYGQRAHAQAILESLLAAATAEPLHRLPELYCGFARVEGEEIGPVPYPVSCSPQAWAAGAIPLLVKAMLGLRLDLERGVVVIDPRLPGWLGEISVLGITVHGERASFTVRRRGTNFTVTTDGPVRATSPTDLLTF